ncbi:MAG: hypothetical protein RL701_6298 [Pseudomonadota bacterium]|jgi:hypothetical protein
MHCDCFQNESANPIRNNLTYRDLPADPTVASEVATGRGSKVAGPVSLDALRFTLNTKFTG